MGALHQHVAGNHQFAAGTGNDQRGVVADAEDRVPGVAREMARDEFEFRGHGISVV
jgi:hypothetical protein